MTSIDSRLMPRSDTRRYRARAIAAGYRLAACALVTLAACNSSGRVLCLPDNEAGALLERSIAYHDPSEVWGNQATHFIWTSTNPERQISYMFEVEMAVNGDFSLFGVRGSNALEYHVEQGLMHALVDGEDTFSDEQRAKMGLVRDDGLFWRNYIGFLAGFPMCLADPDVRLLLPVRDAEIDGQSVVAFDVEFAPGVGEDIYTFYFERDTARLVGCRFYRDDPATDGETILFEGEAVIDGMLLPKTRRWYTNAENSFLGTDDVRAAEPH